MKARNLSKELYNASLRLIPGGVNSPVRAFSSVGGNPIFMERGKGSKIFDADGNEYIDYVMSWGPLIFGHANADILGKISKVLERGTSFGAPTGFELELAKLVSDCFPSIEMVRFVNSGTEACMSAVRLARAYTNRSKILKFDGCYHGHADALLVEAGSGVATLGIPGSPGIPKEVTAHTITVPFNDLSQARAAMESDPKGFAAILVEPVAGNMGVVLPKEGFLSGLRDLANETGAVLIFDEVMTGFRLALGGAQEKYGVMPDLTCLGKIIGGGLPVGAYGGKREIMEKVAPSGPVYQAGTLSGNPVAMAGGIKTLKMLREPGVYQTLEYRTQYLADEMKKICTDLEIPAQINIAGSMFTLFFTNKPVENYMDAKACDQKLFARYFQAMLDEGVYLPPSAYEAWFVSTAHSEKDMDETIAAHKKVLKRF